MKDWIVVILVLLTLVGGFSACVYHVYHVQQQLACNARGGVYVREFMGYTCLTK